MNIFSGLYRFTLVSLALSIPLSAITTVHKVNPSLAQNAFPPGDENACLAEQDTSPQLESTAVDDAIDLSHVAVDQGITPIASNTKSIIGLTSTDTLASNFRQYSQSLENEVELTLEATTMSEVPEIIVLLREEEGKTYRFAITQRQNLLAIGKSVVVRVNTRQGRLYIADDDTVDDYYGVHILDLGIQNYFGEDGGVELKKDQAAYLDYRAWAGSGGGKICRTALNNIRREQPDVPLSIDDNGDVSYEALLILLSPRTGGGVYNRRR